MIRRRVVLAALLAVLFGVGWAAGRHARAGDVYQAVDLFVEVLGKVEQNYVDPVDPEKLVTGAMKGMLRTLDPYSQYLDARAYQNLQSTTHGSFGGVGVEVSIRDGYPVVISPIEGGPAWTAGVRSGDVIVRIDGHSTAGFTIDDMATNLRGPIGSHVAVSVAREGEDKEIELSIDRREIVTKSVRYAFVVEGRIGYMRLADFSESSGSDVRAAIARLRAQGATRLILDLRANPGGLLDQAVAVAEQFVKKGTMVVSTHGRAHSQDHRYFASESAAELDWPMVVLVDGASASASEVVAGALQDLDRALVVGQTSFGKGLVQSVFPLRDRAVALKLTTARYYTPSGRSIDRTPHDTLTFDATAGDEGDGAAPDSAAGAKAAADLRRPVFHTAAGRTVLGGGGIRPDVTVPMDTLPPLAGRLEGRGLTFRFANRWVRAHPDWKPSEALTP
ncbi:MAG: S41 family peptidase, partial [Candidatus Eisenbacteria bacterium]|nr:S41 family peptidase [Candidatus Eisenbacteria bacterium]